MRFELSDENKGSERLPAPFARAVGATALEYGFDVALTPGRQVQIRYLEAWNEAGRLTLSRTDVLTFEAQYRADLLARMVQ